MCIGLREPLSVSPIAGHEQAFNLHTIRVNSAESPSAFSHTYSLGVSFWEPKRQMSELVPDSEACHRNRHGVAQTDSRPTTESIN